MGARLHTTMRCEEAQELLLGMLSGDRERLVEHLAQCEECRVSMAAMEVMAFGEQSPSAAEMIRLSAGGELGGRTNTPWWRLPLAAMAAHPVYALPVVFAVGLTFLGFKVYATAIDTAHQRDRLAELTNRTFLEAQEEDHRTFGNKVEPFDLGAAAVVHPQAPISVTGTVKYPRSCRHYWLLFSEVSFDGVPVMWPQLAVRNSGLLAQTIDHELRVPRDMEREGEVALVCVDEETHQQFKAWRQGTSPLLARDLEVVLRTALTIKDSL